MAECYEGNRNADNIARFSEWVGDEFPEEFPPRYGMDEDTNEEFRAPTKLPMKWEICHCCSGNGSHALHAIAITADEWDEWDYDSREDYFSGVYDTACGECNGSGKLKVINFDYISDEVKKAWDEWENDRYEYLAEVEAERRMGA